MKNPKIKLATEQEMILKGNLWKTCFKLSFPAIIAMVLYGLNVIIDGVFVGRFVGEIAFAGVSIVYPLTQIAAGIGALIGTGASSYLSILIGEKNKKLQKLILGNTNLILVVSSILVMIIGLVFINQILQFVGASGEAFVYGKQYFKITLRGTIVAVGSLAYNMIVRGEGKMKTAAIMMGAGLLINILANYIFMGIFNLGVEGAARGTNVGLLVGIILFQIYCLKGKASFDANPFSFRYDKVVMKEIIALGMPAFIMTIMFVIQGIIIMRVLEIYGTIEDTTFYGAAFRLFNLFATPIYGLMRALQPAAGINFGAKQYERTISSYKIYSLVSFIVMFPMWIISLLFPSMVLGLMLPDVIFSASNIFSFRIFISITPLLCIILTAMTFRPAINKPKPAMIFGIGRQVFFYIPLMIILPRIFGISSIYIGSFGIDLFLTIITIIVLKKDFKKLRTLQQ